MLNLSLLTSDMWSIVIRVIAYNEMVRGHSSPSRRSFLFFHESYRTFCLSKSSHFLQVDWIYYLAFAVVVIGLIIYSVYVISLDLLFIYCS